MCGAITSARPAAAAGSTCSISATMATRLGHRQVVQPQLPHAGLLAPAGQRRRQRMRRVHVALAVGAHQQQALDRLLAQHQVDEAERGAPGPLQVVDEQHHRPLPRGDRAQHLHTALRCARACAVSGSPGSGGTPSSAANSGTTAVSRPAFGPSAARIRSRTSASSSSGSASSSRPSARNA